MKMLSGLDVLEMSEFQPLSGKKVALLCNQASVSKNLEHAIDLFYKAHQRGIFQLKALWGPQHGLFGHTQDNMIEWQSYPDPRTGLPVFSLYGEHRKPTPKMLEGIDCLVVDLQDVGSKYYTFIWTLAHCLEAAAEHGIEVVVPDRPNPLGGTQVEGTFLNENYRSFVGLYPLAIRHGMTIGEIARYLAERYLPDSRLKVVKMNGWQREMYFEDTGLPWAMPSPNMPLPQTALVYPGMCLLEATNLSEGRGTTRPFEIFGAPYLNGWQFAESLKRHSLPGVVFRPIEFQPTFQKHAGQVCQGCFIHVTDRRKFKPFLTGIAIIREAFLAYPEQFAWKQPPYEYEYQKMPFDILVGNGWLREMIESGADLSEMEARWQQESEEFSHIRQSFLMY